jgi:hypothetical protein
LTWWGQGVTAEVASGTILFADEVRQGRRGSYTVPRGFYGVPDAKRVEEAILELRNSAADG